MTMPKFAAKDAETILTRLDGLARHIQANHKSWGMPFEAAKDVVNNLDKTADLIEVATFGIESFRTRQAEVLKRDGDESYMGTFANPMEPIQTEGDEPYMKAYGSPDQSSVVQHGMDSTGRKLAPGHGPFNSGT
jgi:hypothetical protein